MQNAKEHLATLEKLCQTKESLLQAKTNEGVHLSKLLELKEQEVTELQSSGKVYGMVLLYHHNYTRPTDQDAPMLDGIWA